MLHVYDWLDAPAKDEGEKWAKEFLNEFTKPAIDKDYKWLDENKLFCDYRGKRYRCTGASRLGDVWLTADFEQGTGYQDRVDVAVCANWKNEP